MAEQTTITEEPLADRLDALMMRLDQDGRPYDAGLVGEAIEALARPKIVGTPWTTPLKGDRCTRVDGKSREALAVKYLRGIFGSRQAPQVVAVPTAGYYPDRIHFRDGGGRQDTVSASSWANWCRTACRAGGTYERAEATS